MANVLHRITREFIQSANTPDYPVADWIHNPDLSAVTGFDRRYWVVTGDAVTLMDEASRAALDAAAVEAARDALADQIDQTEDILRAVVLMTLDEFNAHSAKINALLTAIDNASSLAGLKTAVAAINDLPTRTAAQVKTAIRNKLGV